MWLIHKTISVGPCFKELIEESPFIFMADIIPAFPTGKGSVISSGNMLPAIGWLRKLA